jgi:hypothetical protein
MKRPAASTVVVFVVILLVTAAIAAAVGLGTDGATAIRVGDASVPAESVNDELRTLADFRPETWQSTPGATPAQISQQVTTQIVWAELTKQYFDRIGEQVTSADRQTAREQTVQGRFTELPKWFRDVVLERQALFVALSRVAGEDDQGTGELRVLRREARRTDVHVDPAYGRYAPLRARVVQYPTPFTPDAG